MSDKVHFWYVSGTVMVIQDGGEKVGNIPANAIVTSNNKNLNEYSLTVMTSSLEDKIRTVVEGEQFLGHVESFSYMGLMSKDEFQTLNNTQRVNPPPSAPVVPDPMGNTSLEELGQSMKEFQEKLKELQKSLG